MLVDQTTPIYMTLFCPPAVPYFLEIFENYKKVSKYFANVLRPSEGFVDKVPVFRHYHAAYSESLRMQ